MRITNQHGTPFDFVGRGGKRVLIRLVDGRERIVGVFNPPTMEIVLDDSESPAWEKGPPNWAQFVSRVAARLNVQLPVTAKPPWA